MKHNPHTSAGCWRPLGILLLIILGLGALSNLFSGVGAEGEEITKAEYGSDWPFTVSSGRLYCQEPDSNVVMKSDGVVYALNGRAIGNAAELGFVNAKETIILKDNEGFFTVGNITAIIQRGLAMC